MTNQNIKEIVVYTLKPETKPETALAFVREILADYDGVLSIETMQDATDPLTFMDTVIWESKEKALIAQKTIEQHPKFTAFAGLFAETKFFAHFKLLAL
jgi:heme-degrading monooxygenase HmoA